MHHPDWNGAPGCSDLSHFLEVDRTVRPHVRGWGDGDGVIEEREGLGYREEPSPPFTSCPLCPTPSHPMPRCIHWRCIVCRQPLRLLPPYCLLLLLCPLT